MDIEDSQRLITEIEMLKVVLYLVRRERAVGKKLTRLGQKTRKKEQVGFEQFSLSVDIYIHAQPI
jgi:hypothetical protein